MKELLKKLIDARSTAEAGEADCARVLASFFENTEIDAEVDIWDLNRANFIARLKSTNEKPALLFVAHLDVVPAERGWKSHPFSAAEQDGKITGRGACDMKGGIAAIAAAMVDISRSKTKLKGDVILAATAGEETDSIGIKRFIETRLKDPSEFSGCIVPEPTNFELVTTHRGLLWLQVATKGKTAHGSMPRLGINAIELMRLFLNELANYANNLKVESDHLLGKPSISVNKICGGSATNIIPDGCTVQIDIRTLPNQNHSHIIKDFENILSGLSRQDANFQADIDTLRDVPPLDTDPNCVFVEGLKKSTGKSETTTVPFTTDAPFVAQLNIPTVIFGPGNPELCHRPNENIKIDDLQKAREIYRQIILDFTT